MQKRVHLKNGEIILILEKLKVIREITSTTKFKVRMARYLLLNLMFLTLLFPKGSHRAN